MMTDQESTKQKKRSVASRFASAGTKQLERIDQSYKIMVPFIQVFNMVNLFIMALGIGNVIVLDIQAYLFFWGGGLIGLLLLGTLLHRGKIFEKTWSWDFWIQKVPLWTKQLLFGYAVFAKFMRISEEDLNSFIERSGEYLQIDDNVLKELMELKTVEQE